MKTGTLELTLKKKWFDMILAGIKLEEYREVKTFWKSRLMNDFGTFRDYSFVRFKNGYASNAPEITLEWLGTKLGEAVPEWSDNWQGECFVISLGKILSTKNIKP